MFGDSSNSPDTALQPFEPDAGSVYPIETVATLVQMPRCHIVAHLSIAFRSLRSALSVNCVGILTDPA
jgi:hypothetical protein